MNVLYDIIYTCMFIPHFFPLSNSQCSPQGRPQNLFFFSKGYHRNFHLPFPFCVGVSTRKPDLPCLIIEHKTLFQRRHRLNEGEEATQRCQEKPNQNLLGFHFVTVYLELSVHEFCHPIGSLNTGRCWELPQR